MNWSRARSFVIDVVLIGAAVSYASDVVQGWLMAHDRALCTIIGVLHILMLPLLMVAMLVNAPGSQVLLEHKPSVLGRVHIWSFVLFACAGFIVPAVFTLGLHIPTEAFFFTTILGPYVVTGFAVWVLLKIDKATSYRYSHVDAHPPKALLYALVLACWAYLLCLEAVMMVVVRTNEVFGGAGTLVAAFVGYLPVRLCIAIAYRATNLELAFVGVAFVHFLYRLAAAAG